MNQIKVKWNKVNPAELSSTCCAQYFAFAKEDRLFMINEIDQACLFTKIIQAAANLSYSIYDLDIWVGYVTEGMENFNENIDSSSMMEALEWSAKIQLLEIEANKANQLLVSA